MDHRPRPVTSSPLHRPSRSLPGPERRRASPRRGLLPRALLLRRARRLRLRGRLLLGTRLLLLRLLLRAAALHELPPARHLDLDVVPLRRLLDPLPRPTAFGVAHALDLI